MESFPVDALVDTHAVIWSIQTDSRLGPAARELIRRSQVGSLAIADVTLLEIALLIDKKRIGVAAPPAQFLREIESNYRVFPITGSIAHDAVKLPLPHSDPFDRVIVATARYHKLPLITRDRHITASGCVETIW